MWRSVPLNVFVLPAGGSVSLWDSLHERHQLLHKQPDTKTSYYSAVNVLNDFEWKYIIKHKKKFQDLYMNPTEHSLEEKKSTLFF